MFDVAGAAGLEPANGGVKVRCVTASPRPYVVLVRLTVSLPRKRESSLRSAPRPLWIASASLGCAPTQRTCAYGKNSGIGRLPIPLFVGWVKGLEPSTPGTTIRCSNQLSYTHHRENGTPEGTRTPGLLLRRQLLYPTELLAHISGTPALLAGAGEGNRTLVSSLEGWCSTIELHPQAKKG